MVVAANMGCQTQKYQTAHQILGLLVVVTMFLIAVTGIYSRLMIKSAAKRGDHAPAWSSILGHVHRWVGMGVWVIMLINVGLYVSHPPMPS